MWVTGRWIFRHFITTTVADMRRTARTRSSGQRRRRRRRRRISPRASRAPLGTSCDAVLDRHTIGRVKAALPEAALAVLEQHGKTAARRAFSYIMTPQETGHWNIGKGNVTGQVGRPTTRRVLERCRTAASRGEAAILHTRDTFRSPLIISQ